MKNESKIKGDGNINIQGVSKSKVSIGSKSFNENKQNKLWIIISIIIAAIALLVQILVGWEQLIKLVL